MDNTQKKTNTTIAMAVFFLGIFMGALDTGIISPARGVIASNLKVTQSASIWMVTIYTLVEAVSMPITGKLADRMGRKRIYITCIILFITGSILCWVSNVVENYNLLLVARAVQALGGGGVMPVATAYIGSSFPPEKRGTALGFVGATYGIATIIGPTLGTAILSIAGNNNWGYLFLINAPISVIIIGLALTLPENKDTSALKKLDFTGAIVLSIMISSLMYALINLQFFDFVNSIKSVDVWPFLLIFIVALPLFIFIEKKASDPILNLNFFTNKQIVITLILSFIVGSGLMGVVFIPQFGENVLRIRSGTGGYIVTLFAVFTGVSAPLGGKLIDKYGVKKLLLAGFLCTVIGSSYQAFVTAKNPSFMNLAIGIAFMGLGMGFTMGTPINYLMMSLVKPSEVSIGQSTVSLFKSMGVAISPNLLVNFVSDAGQKMPGELAKVLPKLPNMGNPMSNKASTNFTMPSDLLDKLQTSDVTSIFSVIKEFVNTMLTSIQATMANNPYVDFTKIKADYLASLDDARPLIENTFQSTLNKGYANLFIGTTIIAFIGFILSLMIRARKE